MANKAMPLFKCFRKNLDIALFPGVLTHLSEMKEFFQSDLNSKRRQLKISDMTWSKTLERLVIFLAYCSHMLKQDIRLELVEDMVIVESFVKHLKKNRRLKNNTAANYLMCFIRVAKFLHANKSRRNYDAVESISDLCAFRTNLCEYMLFWNLPKNPRRDSFFGLSSKNQPVRFISNSRTKFMIFSRKHTCT